MGAVGGSLACILMVEDVAPSYNPNLCSHSSTPETVQLRKRSMIEISTNRATATALCWLLYPDYVNFGYRLPSICTIKQLLPARAVGAGHNSKPNRHTIAGN
ncbi:hypothetical protein FOA52_009158 [Chlamydomonas sp. UWO 241]|nr:hypothetical protein FOA52_009158 [Chlamydomonas sp. UWO 241]